MSHKIQHRLPITEQQKTEKKEKKEKGKKEKIKEINKKLNNKTLIFS